MALFAMDEFPSAKAALEKGYALDASNSQFKIWLRKCDAELQSTSLLGGTSSDQR